MDKDFLGKWGNNENSSLNKKRLFFYMVKISSVSGKTFPPLFKKQQKTPHLPIQFLSYEKKISRLAYWDLIYS